MGSSYDPLHAPDPEAWLALEEFERLRLVRAAHRRSSLEPPRARMHAAAHMVVENQAALGDETPVAATLERLMAEGLDRHEAVHAVGAVVMDHIVGLMQSDDPADEDPNTAYFARLQTLTRQSWLEEFGGD